MIIILMGVCGSGKTTIGEVLAEKLCWQFRDADEFHTKENKDKMSRGIPLTDQDRFPWLMAIHKFIQSSFSGNKSVAVGCSALKKVYRDVLLTGVVPDSEGLALRSGIQDVVKPEDVTFVYLRGSEETLAARMSARHGHFMPAILLRSQLDTLEEPDSSENSVTIDIEGSVKTIVGEIILKLSNKMKT